MTPKAINNDAVIAKEIIEAKKVEADFRNRASNATDEEKKRYWDRRAADVTIKIAKLQTKMQHRAGEEPKDCGCNTCMSGR